MEEVLSQLESSVISPENDETKTNFDGMYKNWGRLGHQEQRRRTLLDTQKSNRNTKLDTCRGILELVQSVEERSKEPEGDRSKQGYRPSIYVAGFTKAPNSYKNVLMMSEWLIEKPEDFDDSWYVVPCPKGVRTLVVATQGKTTVYTKYGYFRLSCNTALPGGNPIDANHNNQCVVLDCFHVEAKNTLYILDLLAWNNQPMTDGETDFRHYWMKTHIEEIPELRSINGKNKILFDILPKVDCSPESFKEFMLKYPHFQGFVPPLDGLLFYHKMAHYVSGETPLVGWLYPFMVPEVLGADIELNAAYKLQKPLDYINQAHFIENFETRFKKQGPFAKYPEKKVDKPKSKEAIEMETEQILASIFPPKEDNGPEVAADTSFSQSMGE